MNKLTKKIYYRYILYRRLGRIYNETDSDRHTMSECTIKKALIHIIVFGTFVLRLYHEQYLAIHLVLQEHGSYETTLIHSCF